MGAKLIFSIGRSGADCFRYGNSARDGIVSQLHRRRNQHRPEIAAECEPAARTRRFDGRFELVLPTARSAEVDILVAVIEVIQVVQGDVD